MNEKKPSRQGFWPAAVIFALFSLPAVAGVPMPDIPEAIKGKQCVEETNFMRKNHMELLLHQRDETMQKGVRTKKHSLKECFTCHIVRKGPENKPVTASNPSHFCRECHDYAAVSIDCFQCHTSVPGDKKTGEDKPFISKTERQQ